MAKTSKLNKKIKAKVRKNTAKNARAAQNKMTKRADGAKVRKTRV